MSSSDHSPDIPRTGDGPPNWAADTDPADPVTPELALVDPGLAPAGEIENEVTMSSMHYGDSTTFSPAETTQPSLDPLQATPLPPLAPLAPPPAPAPDPTQAAAAEAGAIPVSDMRDVPLGTLVFRAGLVPEERLEEALQEGMKTGKRLGEILLERGWVSETDLGRLLAAQKGLPFVELDASSIDPSAPPLLHVEKARLHGALPIGFNDGVPVVAVADPSNDLVVENVRRALATEPVLVVAGRDALQKTINEVYGLNAPEESAPQAVEEAPVEQQPAHQAAEEAPVEQQPAQAVEEAPAAQQPAPPPLPVVPEQPQTIAFDPGALPAPAPAPVAPSPAPPVEATIQPQPSEPVENGSGVWLDQQFATPSQPQPVQQVEAPVAAEPPVVAEPPVAPTPQIFDVPAPAPPAAVAPEQVPVAETQLTPTAPEPLPEPAPQPAETAQADPTWAVVLRLADGERVEVGSFMGEAEAVDGARAVVSQIATDASWPFFAGRFIRPEAIVSVDLVELEVSRWTGSQLRAGAFGSE